MKIVCADIPEPGADFREITSPMCEVQLSGPERIEFRS